MPKPDFYIKEGDTSPPLVGTIVDENEAPIDLTNASTLKFLMINPGDAATKIDNTPNATVLDALTGRVQYQWSGADTDTPGDYDGEFEITWLSGDITTAPNFRYIRIKIGREIG
ncbi:MAG: hypothetical protein ACW99G_21550 [Candidatus Thorarchaeota archaeon]|jgi:hypothetical protein